MIKLSAQSDHQLSACGRCHGLRLRLIAVLAVIVALSSAGIACCDDSIFSLFSMFDATHDVQMNGQCYGVFVFGDQVFMVMDAVSHPFRLPDQHSEDTNIRSYLVTARLTDAKDINANRAVVGPLFTFKGSMSTMANSAGAAFGQKDRDALAAKPFFSFREPGQLIKSVVEDKGKNWHDWALVIHDKKAEWRDLGKRRILPLLGWPNPNYFESQSRRYAVQKEQDGVVRIYDLQNSTQIDDPWLAKVSLDYLSQEDLGNGVIELTDDLNHLVVYLQLGVRIRRGSSEVVLETCKIDGKTIRRENHYLVYERPNVKPKVYENHESQSPVFIDGQFVMFKHLDDRLELEDLNKRVLFSHRLAADEKSLGHFSRLENKQFIYTTTPLGIYETHRHEDEVFKVTKWDYVKDKVTQYSIPLTGLFEKKSFGFYPVDGISIEQAKK